MRCATSMAAAIVGRGQERTALGRPSDDTLESCKTRFTKSTMWTDNHTVHDRKKCRSAAVRACRRAALQTRPTPPRPAADGISPDERWMVLKDG